MDEKCILNPERDCLGLMKANELEKDFKDFSQRNTESHDRFFRRLESLEKHEGIQGVQYENIIGKLSDLTDSLSELKTDSKGIINMIMPLTHRVETLEKEYSSVSKDVAEIKAKPAKRWDGIVEKIISIVVAAVVGFMLAQIGM